MESRPPRSAGACLSGLFRVPKIDEDGFESVDLRLHLAQGRDVVAGIDFAVGAEVLPNAKSLPISGFDMVERLDARAIRHLIVDRCDLVNSVFEKVGLKIVPGNFEIGKSVDVFPFVFVVGVLVGHCFNPCFVWLNVLIEPAFNLDMLIIVDFFNLSSEKS